MGALTRTLLLAAAAAATSGCFPEYSVGDESSNGGPVAMIPMGSINEDLQIDYIFNDLQSVTVHFDYDFEVDEYEVTVARFNDWWQQGHGTPAAGASLDEGGPYASEMKWAQDWSQVAVAPSFLWGSDGEPGRCWGPKEYPIGGDAKTTWQMVDEGTGDGQYPMTCVTWAQAVAFCASEGKRLPTFAEWFWLRTDGGASGSYPWSPPGEPTCAEATVDADGQGCGFPKPVGGTKDLTESGVSDTIGSVFEWLWDTEWLAEPAAGSHTNFINSADNASLTTKHFRAGGSYISTPGDSRLVNQVDSFEAGVRYNDAGFRCVRTVH